MYGAAKIVKGLLQDGRRPGLAKNLHASPFKEGLWFDTSFSQFLFIDLQDANKKLI